MPTIKQFKIAHVARDQAGNISYRYGTWIPGEVTDKRIEVTFDDTGKKEMIAPEEMQLLSADTSQRIKVGVISKSSDEMRTGWIANGKAQKGCIKVLIDGKDEPIEVPVSSIMILGTI